MEIDTIVIFIMLIVGVYLVGCTWKSVVSNYKYEKNGIPVVLVDMSERRERAMQTITSLCGRQNETVVKLEELATLWREDIGRVGMSNDDPAPVAPIRRFQRQVLQNFYMENVANKPYFHEVTKGIVEHILNLFDKEPGDPLSVVNIKGDAESTMNSNAFEILRHVTLVDHSIHVANEIIKAAPPGPMLQKLIIVALAHDLGKLPSLRWATYSTGDHALLSVTAMENIPGMSTLSYSDELMRAVRDHHRTPKEQLTKKLKDADHKARSMEMSEYMKQASIKTLASEVDESLDVDVDRQDVEPDLRHQPASPTRRIMIPSETAATETETKDDTLKTTQSFMANAIRGTFDQTRVRPVIDMTEAEDAAEEYNDSNPVENKDEILPIEEIDLYWFDPDEILESIKDHINLMHGKKFNTFSMKNGYVYIQVQTLWEVIKISAKTHGAVDVLSVMATII